MDFRALNITRVIEKHEDECRRAALNGSLDAVYQARPFYSSDCTTESDDRPGWRKNPAHTRWLCMRKSTKMGCGICKMREANNDYNHTKGLAHNQKRKQNAKAKSRKKRREHAVQLTAAREALAVARTRLTRLEAIVISDSEETETDA
jgi:hypothetical protein